MNLSTQQTYSIKDLEENTGVRIRTIRFYIKAGAVSPATSYATFGEIHLLQLQVISILLKRGIKLSGIKEALNGKTEEQLRSALANTETDTGTWDMEALERVVGPQAKTPMHRNISFAAIGSNSSPEQIMPQSSNIFSRLTSTAAQEHETWQHLRPMDGIEVNIRDDVDPQTKELVKQLIAQLRKSN